MAVKNEFRPNLLASLRGSRVGEGRPMEVPIDQIDRDPGQPRKIFDEIALKALAETIRRYGILQPLVLRRAPETGRWIIEHGERRWRAATMVGLKTVPAFEPKKEADGSVRAVQVIENQQRAGLSNSELANVIAELTKERMKDDELALIVGLHKQQLKHYRALVRLPEALQPWVDRLDARTVYELYLAWEKADEEGRGSIAARLDSIGTGSLSITDARRLIRSLEVADDTANAGTAVHGDDVISRPRLNSMREIDRLRETIDRLVMLLRNAAEILRSNNLEEADRLLREADSAQVHISSPKNGEGKKRVETDERNGSDAAAEPSGR